MNIERIQRALAYSGGTHTVGDIVDGLLEGRYFYLENEGASLVFEVIEYPRKRRIHIFLAAGEMDPVQALRAECEDIARQMGITEVSLLGRKGWERNLAPIGYKAAHVWLVREL